MLVIKYPEITKKTSTPINPPGKIVGQAWKMTTEMIAIALKPSMSFLYEIWFSTLWTSSFIGKN